MAQKVQMVLKPGEESGHKVIEVHFPYRPDLVEMLKSTGIARWQPVLKHWYIRERDFDLRSFFNTMSPFAFIDYRHLKQPAIEVRQKESTQRASHERPQRKALTEGNRQHIEKFRQWLQFRRYSPSTIKTYCDAASGFLAFLQPRRAEEVTNSDMQDYVNRYILPAGYSFAMQNQAVNAAKLLFREVIRSRLEVDKLERPRREHKLPNVLSKEEVKAILDAPVNLKHRAMLSLIYACGLRRSELLNLKPSDVDSKRGLLIIRQAKGRKDRVAPIPDRMVEMLREYYKRYRPKVWLFEGQKPGMRYSPTSLQEVLKAAIEKAGVNRNATLHWLRHSYATHLLENGTDLRFIQELLGHKSSRTTEVYTHVTDNSIKKIRSPFDDL